MITKHHILIFHPYNFYAYLGNIMTKLITSALIVYIFFFFFTVQVQYTLHFFSTCSLLSSSTISLNFFFGANAVEGFVVQ